MNEHCVEDERRLNVNEAKTSPILSDGKQELNLWLDKYMACKEYKMLGIQLGGSHLKFQQQLHQCVGLGSDQGPRVSHPSGM